jgi:hypothetical protein
MRVLLVTYHFPPDAEIGGVRPLQIARYLPQYGIEPWVLTVDPQFAETPNLGLQPVGVPEDRILRTPVDKTVHDRIVSLWQAVKHRRADREAGAAGGAAVGSVPRRLAGWLRQWLTFPDARFGWYRPALRAAEDAIGRIGFDAILSTSPPRVAALIARTLARRHGLPWVMDIRDPWSAWYESATTRASGTASFRFLQDRLFRSCVMTAAAIVHNTERLRQLTCRMVPEATAKTRCVPNGCDAEWRPRRVGIRPAAFRIGYYGQIMGLRSPKALLDGLRLWLDSARPNPALVSVRFTGSGFEEVARQARTLGLTDLLTLAPPVPRQEVADLMADDFVLLLVANAQPLQVPGKTYEYLAAGRRILVLTDHDGATADLLGSEEGCIVAERAEEVSAALDRFYREYQSGSDASIDRAALVAENQYPRRVERFAEVLREVMSRG